MSSDQKSQRSSISNGSHLDLHLMSAVDEIGARIQHGEAIDVEEYVQRFPERPDYLRRLVRTLEGVVGPG